MPVGFNDGVVVFIPKAPVQPRDATHLALPSQLRQLTLSNIVNKIIMKCACTACWSRWLIGW